MLPLLKLIADEQEYKSRDVEDKLAFEFHLTDEERNALLPSGTQAVFTNRVAWAESYLKMAGLLESPKRGYLKVTSSGISLLA